MTTFTLLIALLASILVLRLKPALAYGVFLCTILLYPSYLVVRLGILDISVGRIVITVLLLRCIFTQDISKRFTWNRLDSWVLSFLVISFAMPMIAGKTEVMKILENKAGFMMDTFFAYYAARYCITSQRDLIKTLKVTCIPLVILAIIGILESVGSWQPYLPLKRFRPWEVLSVDEANPRFGFIRAAGPYGTPINLGNTFAMLLPLVYLLRFESGVWKKGVYVILFFVVLGVLSSVSSGPLVLLSFVVFALCLEREKKIAKPLLLFFIFSCIFIAIVSNRPFYHVLVSYINPLGGTGWHRAKLIDLAIEHFDKWWLVGYGGVDPGWGPALGRRWTDITNHFIYIGVQNGFAGLVAFIGFFVLAIRAIQRTLRNSKSGVMRSTAWAFGCVIVGLLISLNTCTFFDQTKSFFYFILGAVGSLFFHNTVTFEKAGAKEKINSHSYILQGE